MLATPEQLEDRKPVSVSYDGFAVGQLSDSGCGVARGPCA